MTSNVGGIDRILRIVIGLALIIWALGLVPGVAPSVWGWIGAVPLLTGIVGWCPPYAVFGLSTCSKK